MATEFTRGHPLDRDTSAPDPARRAPAAERPAPASDVAGALYPLLRRLLGPDLPVRVRAWDGSVIGPPSSPTTIVIESPNALRRMLYAPGELGLSRAFVAGDLSLEGDVFDLLALRDRLGAAGDHVEVGIGPKDLPELIRTARRLGAIGPPLPAPPEEARLKGRRHSPAGPGRHRPPLRRGQRLLPADPRPEPHLLVRVLVTPGGHARGGPDRQVRADLPKLGLARACACSTSAAAGGGWPSTRPSTTARAWSASPSRRSRPPGGERVAEAGLSDRIEIRDQDYRDVTTAVRRHQLHRHVRARRRGQHRRVPGPPPLARHPGGRLLNHAISRPPAPAITTARSWAGTCSPTAR